MGRLDCCLYRLPLFLGPYLPKIEKTTEMLNIKEKKESRHVCYELRRRSCGNRAAKEVA